MNAGTKQRMPPQIQQPGQLDRQTSRPPEHSPAGKLGLPRATRILFQGDSITDGGRWQDSADPNHIFGQGYAYLVAARAGGSYPDRCWSFVNRGISGNTVTDLAARWQVDCLDLAPDVVSVLIGVNDANAVVKGMADDPTGAQFEAVYDQLLAHTRAQLPGVRLVLGEPFALPVGEGADVAEVLTQFRPRVARLAEKHEAVLLSYQELFDTAAERAPAAYWIWDGIHPTYAGHQLLADEWIRAVFCSTSR